MSTRVITQIYAQVQDDRLCLDDGAKLFLFPDLAAALCKGAALVGAGPGTSADLFITLASVQDDGGAIEDVELVTVRYWVRYQYDGPDKIEHLTRHIAPEKSIRDAFWTWTTVDPQLFDWAERSADWLPIEPENPEN